MACKFRYKNSRNWWIKWYANGKARYEPTHTPNEKVADYLLAKKKKELAEGSVPGFLINTSLSSALTEYWNEARTYRTSKTYSTVKTTTNAFLVCVGDRKLKSISSGTIEEYLIWRIREKKISMVTRNTTLRILRAFFNWCVGKDYLARNPTERLKRVKVPKHDPKYLTHDQACKILAVSRTTDLYPLVATALYAGLRRGELFNLEWQDIDFNNRRIYIRNKSGFTTKSKEQRDVRLNPHLKKILLQFRKDSGHCFDKKNFRKRFAAIALAAGVRPSVHALRHTIGTHLLSEGMQEYLSRIAKMYGHSEIRTTKEYAKLLPVALDRMIDKLNFGKS